MRLAALLAAAVLLPWEAAACAIKAQTHIEPTPDGSRFLVVLDRRTLKVISREGQLLDKILADGPVAEAAISPDGKSVAYCPERRGLRIATVGSPEQPAAPERTGDCSDLSWVKDGQGLAYVVARNQTEAIGPVAVVQAKLWCVDGGTKTLHVERIPLATWERAARTEESPAR